jgi:hypothetical protein
LVVTCPLRRFTGADEAVALAEKAHELFAKECTVKCGIKVRAIAMA